MFARIFISCLRQPGQTTSTSAGAVGVCCHPRLIFELEQTALFNEIAFSVRPLLNGKLFSDAGWKTKISELLAVMFIFLRKNNNFKQLQNCD